MFGSIADYLAQLGDVHAPPIPKPELQQFDNYQIYSLLCNDISQEIYNVNNNFISNRPFSYTFHYPIPTENTISANYSKTFAAVQTYGTTKPSIDYISILQSIPIIKNLENCYWTTVTRIDGVNISVARDPNNGSNYGDIPWGDVPGYVAAITAAEALNLSNLNQYSYVITRPVQNIIFNQNQSSYFIDQSYQPMQDLYTVNGVPPQLVPTINDLLKGSYYLDTRLSAKRDPPIIPTKNEVFTIEYFQWDNYEPHPEVNSCNYRIFIVEAIKGKKLTLPLNNISIGSLKISSQSIKDKLSDISMPNRYNWEEYYLGDEINIWNKWINLYTLSMAGRITGNQLLNPINSYNNFLGRGEYEKPIEVISRALYANHNYWNNDDTIRIDLNIDNQHRLFTVDKEKAYKYYVIPLPDDAKGVEQGIGDLEMDSIKIKEIHAALDAGKYARNELNKPDEDKPRITTLGYYIEKIASLLGHRLDANGKFDYDREKADFQRDLLNKPNYKNGTYSLNAFAEKGMVIPHLPTSYNSSDRLLELYDVVYDIPQLLAAMHDQIDKSMGIQHGSEIRTLTNDNRVAKYPNQLALLIDLHQQISAINTATEGSKLMQTVTSQEVRELFAGIGIPVATKYLQVTGRDGKPTGKRLPYFGFQVGKDSILNQLTTLKINIAIILGTMMPKVGQPKSEVFNPLKFFKAKKK